MLRLNREGRRVVSETLRELANLFAAGFVIGQFVTRTAPSWCLMLAGIVVWTVLFALALVAAQGTNHG